MRTDGRIGIRGYVECKNARGYQFLSTDLCVINNDQTLRCNFPE